MKSNTTYMPSKRYIALTPSKASVSAMKAFDENINFIKFIPISFNCFPDSNQVASIALKCARKKSRNALSRGLKWFLFRCQYNWSRTFFEANKNNTVALCWNGINGSRRAFVEGAKRAGAATVLFELSPLPNRVTIDKEGVNFYNSLPREFQFYQKWQTQRPSTSDEWTNIKKDIISRCAYDNKNVKQEAIAVEKVKKPYLFVPLQVQTDSQVKVFGGLVKDVYEFIQIIDQYACNLPDNWTLRIKEHPSSHEVYNLDKRIKNTHKIIVDNTTDTMDLVRNSDGVITINSSVGLESLFFEKPVLVFGKAFYGFHPIVNVLTKTDDLKEIFSDPKKNLRFNKNSVTPFLNYLCCEYYPTVINKNGKVQSIDSIWLENFKQEL